MQILYDCIDYSMNLISLNAGDDFQKIMINQKSVMVLELQRRNHSINNYQALNEIIKCIYRYLDLSTEEITAIIAEISGMVEAEVKTQTEEAALKLFNLQSTIESYKWFLEMNQIAVLRLSRIEQNIRCANMGRNLKLDFCVQLSEGSILILEPEFGNVCNLTPIELQEYLKKKEK